METELEYREFEIREVNAERREISGIAVPWGQVAKIGSYSESFERGAVQDSDDALLFWRHMEPIGKIVKAKDTDEGWAITARISETERGNEAYTLARDGVVKKFSIGFEPKEHRDEVAEDGSVTRVRTKVRVGEVSLVPFPAYEGADVSQVREAEKKKEGVSAMETATVTVADLTEVRQSIEDLSRRFDTFTPQAPAAPVLDTRSAGEVLKAIASGDAETVKSYETLLARAYTGGTSADAIVKPAWVGDLTRVFDASSGVLADVFSTGTLPSSGNTIEYAELNTNTIDVAEQAAEGDDIVFGNVKITTKTAPVKTYAGGTQLTRQEIERSTVGVLNTSLDALAIAAGARKKAVLRAAYNALVTAREGVAANGGVVVLGATLAAATAGNWEDALIDAALKYEQINLPLEVLIVSATVFKKMRSLTVSGERVFRVAEENASGTLNLPGLTGNLAGIPVRLDSGQSGDKAVFANARALRQYDSALVSLSDENIVNLSKAFAVYKYGAVAAEIPAAVVPVKLAAS